MAFPLDDNPYMNNAFLLAPERDLVPRLRGKNFSHNPDKPRKRLDMALENVARVYTAGVPIGLGTDSGFEMKLQAAQHRELQLLNEAGDDSAGPTRTRGGAVDVPSVPARRQERLAGPYARAKDKLQRFWYTVWQETMGDPPARVSKVLWRKQPTA